MTMLQFSATLYTTTTRLMPRSSWRFAALVANNSSTITSEQPAVSAKEGNDAKFSEIQDNVVPKEKNQDSNKMETNTKPHSLEKKWLNQNDKSFFWQVENAKSMNELLDLATLPNLSTNHALHLISSITNQINSGKLQAADIEADKRFICLRKIVEVNDKDKAKVSADLLRYSQLSTPAMIEVIAMLRGEGNRNVPLLRTLSYNIVKYNLTLNLQQCATLLYSMAVLNFQDKALLEKISSDLLKCIPKSTKAVTNKSIIMSLGFLHYKNESVLDAFCETLFGESINYTLQDRLSILQTFAALQYKSVKANLFIKKLAEVVHPVKTFEIEWLDIIWSLAALDAVQPRHIEILLEPAFMESLIGSSKFNIPRKIKLLNINAVAQYILKDYKGHLLDKNSEIFNAVPLIRSKEKKIYIDALSETLTTLLSSSSHFQTNVDTKMGFLLDAEYYLDDKYNVIKVEDWNKSSNVKRIAIMVHDYHDYCQGQNDLLGTAYLYTQLLKAKGYKVIKVSYENFSIQDKIEKRILYLKKCINDVYKKST